MNIVKLNSGRDTIQAKLDTGKKGGEDAFLICHGFGGSMYEPEESSVMADLTEMGYAAMLVSHKTGSAPDLIFQEQVRQLVDAVTYLLGKVRAKRIHVFGISMGAANAVSLGAIDSRIASVAESSGISDCNLWLQQRLGDNFHTIVEEATKIELSQLVGGSSNKKGRLFEATDLLNIPKSDGPKVKGRITKVSARTVRSLLTYRPILAAAGIPSGIPTFFFHGTGDELVSHEHSLALFDATKSQNKHKLLIEGGSHGMILEQKVRDEILSFYIENLKENKLLQN